MTSLRKQLEDKLDSTIEKLEQVLAEDPGPITKSSMPEIRKSFDRLRYALEESVRLQAHYAELLNMRDGGQRIIFRSADEWLERLDNMKTQNRTNYQNQEEKEKSNVKSKRRATR